MLTRRCYLFIFIIFLLNIDPIKTVCIPGENCPFEQGQCIQSECVCDYRFRTLYTNEGNQIYCNYRLINRYIPLILEFCLPSAGLLYMGRKVHGYIKLFSFLVFFLQYKVISLRYNIFLGFISLIFIFLQVIDLFCLLFLIYYDGNGMPLL